MRLTSTCRAMGPLGLLAFSALVAFVLPVLADSTSESRTRLLHDIQYLASDELEGRGVGTAGIDLAAEFIRSEFEKAGLDVTRADGDAFQPFSMNTGSELGSPNKLKLTGPNGVSIELQHDEDFRTCSFGGSGDFNAEMVFCGYAINAADQGYRDFEDVDVEGKVAIIMRRVPQQGNPHVPFSSPHGGISRHADLRSKVSNTFREGAAAILFVNDPYSIRNNAEQDAKALAKAKDRVIAAAEKFNKVAPDDEQSFAAARRVLAEAIQQLQSARQNAAASDDPLMKFGYGGGPKGRSIPVMHISREACDRVLRAALDKSLEELEAEIDSDLQPRSAVLRGWAAAGIASVKRDRADVKNVIGVLKGQGPLSNETVVVGAHYDHLGYGGEGSLAPGTRAIHNGADDNASGVVGLIELARRLGSRDDKLPRRIVFIAFTGEELGLVGSAHYVKQPLFPLDTTIAMFNLDMVGRLQDEKLTVFGAGTAKRWKGLLEKYGQQQNLTLTLKDDGFGPSDQTSFYAKKIPVLHFFTGTHSDYHRPTDDWEKINVDGMDRVLDVIEQTIVATARATSPPQYVQIKRKSSAQRSGSRPYFGSIPDFSGDVVGYAISGVAPGSPAEKAGLKGGDVIVQLGEQKIGGLDDFDLALRTFSPADEVAVVIERDGKKLKFNVVLAIPR